MCKFINMKNVNLTNHFSVFKQKIFVSLIQNFLNLKKFSEAKDKEEFDGIALLLECEDDEYVSGLEIFKFKTGDKD